MKPLPKLLNFYIAILELEFTTLKFQVELKFIKLELQILWQKNVI